TITAAPPANQAPTISIVEPDGTSDTANNSYTISWTDTDPDNNAAISLYYDNNNTGADGTLITSSLTEDADGASDTYAWNTSSLANGIYYVYATINDGVNPVVTAYSSGAVTVSHPAPPASGMTFVSEVHDASGSFQKLAAATDVAISGTTAFVVSN